jgi:uncharacterized protein
MINSRRPVVFDTSTLVACCLHPDRQPAVALNFAANNHDLFASKATLAELIAVLGREKFNRWRPKHQRAQFIQMVIAAVKIIEPHINVSDCRDPTDNKFLSLALSASAQCILVTSDPDLLVLVPYREIEILNVHDFLARSAVV